MVLNDIRRHLNRKTSHLDQSKANVIKLKKELESLKSLYKEKKEERIAHQKRKERREEEESTLLNELNALKTQAAQNDQAHQALIKELTSKFADEVQAQKKRMEMELEIINKSQSKEISDCQIHVDQEKLRVQKLQEEQLNQKKTQLQELVALYDRRKEEYAKISTNSLDDTEVEHIEKRRDLLHSQLMSEARRILEPLRSTVKELERRLLVMVLERQRRKDRMMNSTKTLSVFCKSFIEHEPTAKLISMLKCNIAELEQQVDDLRKKVPPVITSSSDSASILMGNRNNVDVVNVIQNEENIDNNNIKEDEVLMEEGEDTVDGITIYPRDSEEIHE